MQANPPITFPFLHELSVDFSLDEETSDLKQLWEAGFEISPTLIIPAEIEENYYRLNNLPEQLSLLFKYVNTQNPDEDDIEELEPLALALFKKHFLLDEIIDLFYAALEPLPSKITMRRSGSTQTRTALKGRPSLIALKKLWADAWTYDALLNRIESTQSIAVEAQHVFIQAKSDYQIYNDERVADILGKSVEVKMDAQNRITQLLPQAS